MGTPDFSVPVLQRLYDDGHDIVSVFCQPPKPRGRGKKTVPCPVHKLSNSLKINTYHSVKKEYFTENVDVIVVVAFGKILKQWVLDFPRLGCVNIHASLLPRWRGAAPIHRAIEHDDHETGVTLMQMDQGLDTGDIIEMRKVLVSDHTTGQMHDILSKMGTDMISDLLHRDAWTATSQPQSGVTYAEKIEKSECVLNSDNSCVTNVQKIRAFSPYPCVKYEYQSEMIKIHNADLGPGELEIPCKDGVIHATQIQRPGKKAMDTKVALRGLQKC